MKIIIGKVEGVTIKKGSKQNQSFIVIQESDVKKFYDCLNSKGIKYILWDVRGDWSLLGIMKRGCRRCTYTTDFEIKY